MRLTFNSTRINFSTGFRIDASKWDEQKQRVKNGCTNKAMQSAAEINTVLNQYEAELHSIFKKFETLDTMPTKDQVKEAFNRMHLSESAKEEGVSAMEEVQRNIALTLARNAAIPEGQVLSNVEMENLVNDLFACNNVNYTPDGKNVLCILKQQEIEHLLA